MQRDIERVLLTEEEIREKVSEIGQQIALKYGLTFLDRDFKKKNGFRRSIELSKAFGLYRQNYCGCEFSKRQAGSVSEPAGRRTE